MPVLVYTYIGECIYRIGERRNRGFVIDKYIFLRCTATGSVNMSKKPEIEPVNVRIDPIDSENSDMVIGKS